MDDCELSSLELYESDWVCVKTGIFDKQASNKNNNINNSSSTVINGKCNFGKKGKETQKTTKLKFFCGWNKDKETLAVTAREGEPQLEFKRKDIVQKNWLE